MLEHGPNQIPNTLTSSQEVFPAKTSPTQEKARDSQESEADCSMKSAALLATWDQESLSWRTSQRCLLGGWMKFSGRWPRSGTMQNGIAYRLRPLVPRISGTGCSFVPTARATDGSKGSRTIAGAVREAARGKNIDLGVWIKVGLVPTPTARDWRGGHKGTCMTTKRTPNDHGCQLNDMVDGGQLNPNWVEWLMGFPPGWTDLEASETQ